MSRSRGTLNCGARGGRMKWWPFRRKKKFVMTRVGECEDFSHEPRTIATVRGFDLVEFPGPTVFRRELKPEEQFFIGGERVVAIGRDGYFVEPHR